MRTCFFAVWAALSFAAAVSARAADPVFDSPVVLKRYPGTVTPVLPESPTVSVADFNDDSHLDVAAICSTGNLLFLGNGDGSFQPEQPLASPASGGGVACDWDGDGAPDLVVAAENVIEWFRNDGRANFTVQPLFPADGASGLIAADFNSDGRSDIAWTQSTTGNCESFALLNLPSGEVCFLALGPNDTGTLLSGDLNGDGAPELWVGSRTLTNDNGVLVDVTSPHRTLTAATVLLVDLDGNGIPDAVDQDGPSYGYDLCVGSDGDTSSTLRIRLDGGEVIASQAVLSIESPAANLSDIPKTYGALAIDFDGDGDLDLAVCTASGYHNVNPAGQRISLVMNRGAGQIAETDVLSADGWCARSIATGDFDEDGRPDLVLFNQGLRLSFTGFPPEWIGRSVVVVLNSQERGLIGVHSFGRNHVFTQPEANQPFAVDIDHDGDQDLLWYDGDGGTPPIQLLQVRLNLGNGRFSPRPVLVTGAMPTGSGRRALDLVDMDGNGQPEPYIGRSKTLVVDSTAGPPPFGYEQSETLKLVNATWPFPATTSAFDGPLFARVQNAANWTVMYLSFQPGASTTPTSVRVFKMSNGQLTQFPDLTIPGRIAGTNFHGGGTAVFGDINGDGLQDAIVMVLAPGQVLDPACSCYLNATLLTLLGVSDGSFAIGGLIPGFTGNAVLPPVLGYLDAGPTLDIAWPFTEGTMNVALGIGDGSFNPPHSYAGLAFVSYPAIADVNRDGYNDLVSVGSDTADVSPLLFTSERVAMWLNDGSGGFDHLIRTSLVTGPLYWSTQTADFNGDGVSDLFGLRGASGAWMSVNRTPAPPCPSDINNDRTINTLDLILLLQVFGQSIPNGTGADIVPDGVVNTLDLILLLQKFGQACP